MQNIHVGRYSNAHDIGWAGWIEPNDKSWIAFIDLDGRPTFFLERDATGAVVKRDASGAVTSPLP